MLKMFSMLFQSLTRALYMVDEAMAAGAELANAAHKEAKGFNTTLDLERKARHTKLAEQLKAA